MAEATRRTAGVLGVAFGWMLVIENMLGSWRPGLRQWLLGLNMEAFVTDGTTWHRDVCEPAAQGLRCTTIEEQLTLAHGTGYLLALTALAAVVSLVVFGRRDVA